MLLFDQKNSQVAYDAYLWIGKYQYLNTRRAKVMSTCVLRGNMIKKVSSIFNNSKTISITSLKFHIGKFHNRCANFKLKSGVKNFVC